MDKNTDFNYYGMPQFGNNMYETIGNYDMPTGANNMEGGTMFNPIKQYEQAYMYYRYLSMQMEYKIKCKEYEKMTSRPENMRENGRKIE